MVKSRFANSNNNLQMVKSPFANSNRILQMVKSPFANSNQNLQMVTSPFHDICWFSVVCSFAFFWWGFTSCPCRVVLPSFELCVAHTCGVAPALLCIPHMCVLSSRSLARTVDALPPRPATPRLPPPTSRLSCIRDLPVFVSGLACIASFTVFAFPTCTKCC